MKSIPFSILLALGIVGCTACVSAQDDRSFYHEFDRDAWPGDDLSENQVLAAFNHFRDPQACHHPWHWALVGPGRWVLKGTVYLVSRRMDAGIPNVSWSRGYWGGTPLYEPIPPVSAVKIMIQAMATEDCLYGQLPTVDKSGPNYGGSK